MITPRFGTTYFILPEKKEELHHGQEAKRAFDAMMTIKKIDVAAIEAARRG